MTPAERRARLHVANCSRCQGHEHPCHRGAELIRTAKIQRRAEHASPKIAEAARRAALQWEMILE